jgi:PhnB protein
VLKKVQQIIKQMRVSPYIFFNGNCEEALNFYKNVFDVEVTDFSRYSDAPMAFSDEDKLLIMHARLSMGVNNVIMVCDAPASRKSDIGSNVQLSVEFEEVEEMNAKFEKLSEGGSITMPLQDTFWGSRFGMVEDKFKVRWMLNCQIKKQ